ncbi:MAG: hypothetical protein JWM32_200 [Verrucomicrobia bacterium]|nr:hypothetical protein [Verrucomicrobiota bacterium]
MAVKFQDYYETLGIPRGASAEEIKQAFRTLARLHHPDVAKNKVTGEAKFKEINEAYEVLGDPDKRRRYDELGPGWQADQSAGPRASRGRSRTRGAPADFEFGGTGFSDFFESFFGSGGGGAGFSQDGSDAEADLLVTLEEALRGSTRRITLRRSSEGHGMGQIHTYQVRIPAGVHEGQRIRLAGQGSAGAGGGAAGDLFLKVRLARHPDLVVEGSDLYYELPLAPWEAVLGVQVTVPTLDGPTSLRVPAGTSAGRQLRLRGLGLPQAGGSRGDLYATVSVQLPTTVSEEERAAWEKLASVSSFKARDSG